MVVCVDADGESSCCAMDLCIWWRICHSSSFMVVWTRVWFCGAALLPRATQRRVELYGHDSAIPRCMARSVLWPSVNLARLIYNWISMGPSTRCGDRHSVESYSRAEGAEKILALASSPPSAKSVMLGGGSDPPSTKSVMLGVVPAALWRWTLTRFNRNVCFRTVTAYLLELSLSL